MTRVEYYFGLQNILKENTKLYISIEVYNQADWYPIDIYPSFAKEDSEYRISFCAVGWHDIVSEHAFDKFYLPMMDYHGKTEVEYRDSDLSISLNNIKYIIMDKFQKKFM